MNSKKLFIIVTLLSIVSLIFTSGFAQIKMQHQHKEHHSEMQKLNNVTI